MAEPETPYQRWIRRGSRPSSPRCRSQLAGTSEILSVLARSSSVQNDIFDAIVQNARSLCRAQAAQINLADDGTYRLARSLGQTPEFVRYSASHPMAQDRTTLTGRVRLDRASQQIEDAFAHPDHGGQDLQQFGGYRSILGAPMLRSPPERCPRSRMQ